MVIKVMGHLMIMPNNYWMIKMAVKVKANTNNERNNKWKMIMSKLFMLIPKLYCTVDLYHLQCTRFLCTEILAQIKTVLVLVTPLLKLIHILSPYFKSHFVNFLSITHAPGYILDTSRGVQNYSPSKGIIFSGQNISRLKKNYTSTQYPSPEFPYPAKGDIGLPYIPQISRPKSQTREIVTACR